MKPLTWRFLFFFLVYFFLVRFHRSNHFNMGHLVHRRGSHEVSRVSVPVLVLICIIIINKNYKVSIPYCCSTIQFIVFNICIKEIAKKNHFQRSLLLGLNIQTAQTTIRLLLQEQSDLGLHCLLFGQSFPGPCLYHFHKQEL